MQVIVNSKPVQLAPEATLADLIAHLGMAARSVVVEHNGSPVARSEYGRHRLHEGDRVEVVRPVQGGAVPPASGTAAHDSLSSARLYLVTDPTVATETLQAVLRAGVDLLQLRQKDAVDVDVLSAGQRFVAVAGAAAVPLVVNDRPDLCYALGAQGVHLGQEDLPPRYARELLGPGVLIGRSTHSQEQIRTAIEEHDAGWIDYIAVGPVHATPTKPGRPAVGYDLVRFAATTVGFPWFAIGGIDLANVHDVVDAGARRIVVVRAITQSPDPVDTVRALVAALPPASQV